MSAHGGRDSPNLAAVEQRNALGELARLEAMIRFDLGRTTQAGAIDADELLLATDVARRLKSTTEYIYRHARQFPFTVRLGRTIRFSSTGLDEFIRTRQGR
ncbi:MAG: hypothetical protein M3S32_04465 [Acidobacteriota bacterium]|nr:hypothetical protein [Acidobacteriota bacterium]